MNNWNNYFLFIIIVGLSSCDNYSHNKNDDKKYLQCFFEKVDCLDSLSKIEIDTIIDNRDRKRYPVISIGNQVWFGKNLDYATPTSFYYRNDSSRASYGRLYYYKETESACPEGWRIPTDVDFYELIDYLGGPFLASKSLRSINYWDDDSNGTNKSNFCALPTGNKWGNNYAEHGELAVFWCTNKIAFYFTKEDFIYVQSKYDDDIAFCIRCIKDN
ncbi:MAG: hypothetical protein FWC39_03325 [Bacteroidetes bacterium]|nr:hypothetical protein [Bacteroidota bacterium]